MNERNQVINFLLESCDAKDKIIEALKKKIAELEQSSAPKVENEDPAI